MKRKFKVRLSHLAEGLYEIEYAHYYILPIYRKIKEWDSIFEMESTLLYKKDRAEEVAGGFTKPNDVRDHNIREKDTMNKFLRDKREKLLRMAPYKRKQIL